MDKDLVSYQILLAGLKAKAEEAKPCQASADMLNDWARQVKVGITFFWQDGEIIWVYN